MDYYICLFFVVFLQTAYGQIFSNIGHNNFHNKLPFSNTNFRNFVNNRQSINGLGGLPKSIAGKEAIGNIPSSNANNNLNAPNAKEQIEANDNRVNALIENATPSKNQANPANVNLATPKLTEIKQTARKLANSLARNNIRSNFPGNYGNYPGLYNPNLINNYQPNHLNPIGSNFGNNIAANVPNPLYGNYGNSYSGLGAFNPYQNFNMANPQLPIANGNIANTNFAPAMATGNLANAIMPGATFSIGGNPFTVLSGLPGMGNTQLGLSVTADSLEVDGSVNVAGKLPFYSTVALSGSLPVDGSANVNYGCTQRF